MLETGVRQFRMAFGVAMGRRISTRNLVRLINDALATIAEFGAPGADAEMVVAGAVADPKARRDLAVRGLRRTASRLATLSPFYAERMAAAGVDPKKSIIFAQSSVSAHAELASIFNCVARIGWMNTELKTTGFGLSVSEKDSSMAYGLGANFNLSRTSYLQANWTSFYDKHDTKIQGFGLAYGMRF